MLQNIAYLHPDKEVLFRNINLTLNHHDKVALIGNNGSGKSTLLKIIAGEWQTSEGQLTTDTKPYYVPQISGQFNHVTVSAALNDWQLTGLDLSQKMETLSGGQKIKVFLAGISIHQPKLVLLDEPSNHLDTAGRGLLYNFIQSTASTLLVVSHDRTLLNLMKITYELSSKGLHMYGGNYDFYVKQKRIESNALNEELKSKEKLCVKPKKHNAKLWNGNKNRMPAASKKERKPVLPAL